MYNIVETFSGIGAQAAAIKRIAVPHKISATVEWDINAIFAYDILQNGSQDLSSYRFHSKSSIIEVLSNYNLSSDGDDLLSKRSLSSLSLNYLKTILHSIERNNNLVDITKVHANQLDDDIDILTYSFPCQDLSPGALMWKNKTGLDRNSGNRSSLLWQIERLLLEFQDINKPLPRFLLMENVTAIRSALHIDHFNEWLSFLESCGYQNIVYDINAKDVGIPQNRTRTFVISIHTGHNISLNKKINEFHRSNNLEKICKNKPIRPIGEFLKLDYSNEIYFSEAKEATPNYTQSREKIFYNNIILAVDSKPNNNEVAKTVTTKQDRHPNSGIVAFEEYEELFNSKYRNLTPREVFLIMGFKEESFNQLISENIIDSKEVLTQAKLLKLAGNSIVVDVLEIVFEYIIKIDKEILPVKETKSHFNISINF